MRRRFRYSSTLKYAFLQGGISDLQDIDNRGWVPGSGANVFVSNHDTERVRPFPRPLSFAQTPPCRTQTLSTLTRLRTPTSWRLFSPCNYPHPFRNSFSWWICPLLYSAHPYGKPTILSSYSNFYDTDAGAPDGGTIRLPDLFTSSHTDSPVSNFSRRGRLLGHRQRQ